MSSMKERAANVAASVKSAVEKIKITVQEKVEKMTARDQGEKDMAKQKKEERMKQADRKKQAAWEHNVAARRAKNAQHEAKADVDVPSRTDTGGS